MSRPTSCLFFFPPSNHISRPLSRNLAAPCYHLAHLAFHPPIQDRLSKFPTITQFKRRYFALCDVPIQGIGADPKILRRLSYVHHFARFAHEERPSCPYHAPNYDLFAPVHLPGHWGLRGTT